MGAALIGIASALIAAFGSIICQLIISKRQDKEHSVEQARRDQKIDDQFSAISSRLEEHNNYASKFGVISDSIHAINLGLAEVRKDIEYLRKGTDI